MNYGVFKHLSLKDTTLLLEAIAPQELGRGLVH
jgi:hypothetical protein